MNFTAFWSVVLPGLGDQNELEIIFKLITHIQLLMKDGVTGLTLDVAHSDLNLVRSSVSEVSNLSITEGSKSADWRDCSSVRSKIANTGQVCAAQNTILKILPWMSSVHLHCTQATYIWKSISYLHRGQGLTNIKGAITLLKS